MADQVKEACCAVPAVITDNYEPKGSYHPYGGLEKAYIVTPAGAHDKGVVFIYDIFGYWPATIQAADLLSAKLNAKVVMPNFFRDKPFPIEGFETLDPAVKGKQLGEFFTHLGNFDARLPEVQDAAKQLKSEGKTFVGVVGLCWGGRLAINAGSQEGTYVDAVASCHPPMLKETDGGDLRVPLGIYPSKTDQIDIAEKIYNDAKSKPFGALNEFKAYSNMHHGFAGAHAKFDDPENVKEFADIYERITKLFNAAAAAQK